MTDNDLRGIGEDNFHGLTEPPDFDEIDERIIAALAHTASELRPKLVAALYEAETEARERGLDGVDRVHAVGILRGMLRDLDETWAKGETA